MEQHFFANEWRPVINHWAIADRAIIDAAAKSAGTLGRAVQQFNSAKA